MQNYIKEDINYNEMLTENEVEKLKMDLIEMNYDGMLNKQFCDGQWINKDEFEEYKKDKNFLARRASEALIHYFIQVKHAEKELKGIFTKEEIYQMANIWNSTLYSDKYCKRNVIYDLKFESEFGLKLGFEREPEILIEKIKGLTEMQIHVLFRMIKENVFNRDFEHVVNVFECIEQ